MFNVTVTVIVNFLRITPNIYTITTNICTLTKSFVKQNDKVGHLNSDGIRLLPHERLSHSLHLESSDWLLAFAIHWQGYSSAVPPRFPLWFLLQKYGLNLYGLKSKLCLIILRFSIQYIHVVLILCCTYSTSTFLQMLLYYWVMKCVLFVRLCLDSEFWNVLKSSFKFEYNDVWHKSCLCLNHQVNQATDIRRLLRRW